MDSPTAIETREYYKKLRLELREEHLAMMRRYTEVMAAIETQEQRLITAAHEEMDRDSPRVRTLHPGRSASNDRQPDPDRDRVPAPRAKRTCSICRKPGHRKHNCPLADKHFKAVRQNPPPLAKGKRACSFCRQPGHRATTCPKKRK